MATVNYTISHQSGAEILQGGQGMSGAVFAGWTGSFIDIDPDSPIISTVPASLTAVVGGDTYTIIPDSTNGVKNWPAGETWYDDLANDNPYYNYVTYKSQSGNIQYPSSGKSFDIWSGGFWKYFSSPGLAWTDVAVNGPYKLSTSKYTLFYDYTSGSPTAHCWVKGGQIDFTLVS